MNRFPTALDTAAAFRSGDLSPSEAVDEVLERYDWLDPALGAIVWRDAQQARRDVAAAVAAGMVLVVHANDVGGSSRIPASCCGLVGLKPSRWRVPSAELGWFGLWVEGVVAHTVADTAAILDVVSVPDPLLWEQAPPPAGPFAAEVGADPGRLRVPPTMAIEPPTAGEVLADAHATPDAPPLTALAMAAFTVPCNANGQPAVSLPVHQTSDGLPIGVQLIGGPWGEALLLRVAAQLEQAIAWRDRHPSLG
jgi:Asp-tRNA(Asn)/Glu-tRNA(Gln) amidotransferase A subunit family amidase